MTRASFLDKVTAVGAQGCGPEALQEDKKSDVLYFLLTVHMTFSVPRLISLYDSSRSGVASRTASSFCGGEMDNSIGPFYELNIHWGITSCVFSECAFATHQGRPKTYTCA